MTIDKQGGRSRRNSRQVLLRTTGYDPNRFLNFCTTVLAVRNDAQLSRAMAVTPATISRIRARATPVPASFLIRFHEKTSTPFAAIRTELGVSHDVPL